MRFRTQVQTLLWRKLTLRGPCAEIRMTRWARAVGTGEQLGADSDAQAFESERFRSACAGTSGAVLSMACNRMELAR